MVKEKPKKFWDMKMLADTDNEAEIFIYGDIEDYQWIESDVTPTTFKSDLDSLGSVSKIHLYINSYGGSVFAGVAIYNMLKRHEATVDVHVDGLAASIASVIAMAGDTIFMPKNSMLMIHNPWTFAIGNAKELRKQADDLDRIGESAVQSYLQKAGDKLAQETLQELLDGETWLSADEAVELGLADVVEAENRMVASVSTELLQRYKNVPQSLLEKPKATMSADEKARRQQIVDESKANSAYLETILGGVYK